MIYLHLKGTEEAKEAFAPLFKELDSKGIAYTLKNYDTFQSFECDQARGFISECPVINPDLSVDLGFKLVLTISEVGSEKIEWHYINLKFICAIYTL